MVIRNVARRPQEPFSRPVLPSVDLNMSERVKA